MAKIEHGKTYTAVLELSWIQSWASNEQIAEYLTALSFDGVVVTGSGNYRNVRAKYVGPTKEGNIPAEITEFCEVEEET